MFVYNPSSNTHCEVVRNLARVLQGAFCITIFMDSVDANHQDPTFWCNHSFTSASHIIYIASPEVSSAAIQGNSKSICNTHDAALKLIRKELGCSHPTKQIVVVTFPYSINATPSELSHLRKFNLMKDFDEFSRYIKPPTPFVPTTLLIWSAQHLEMYMDLINSIYLAEKEFDTVNSYSSNAPEITITVNSMENFPITDDDDTSEDEERLLTIQPHYNFRISNLELSGGGDNNSEDQPTVTTANGFKNDIQDLEM